MNIFEPWPSGCKWIDAIIFPMTVSISSITEITKIIETAGGFLIWNRHDIPLNASVWAKPDMAISVRTALNIYLCTLGN